MSKGYRTIKLEKKRHIASIILNRPDKLNAINNVMLHELSEAIDIIEKDANVRCIIIRSNGERAFSAGADFTELRKLTSENSEAFSVKGQQVFSKLEEMAKPVIAAIYGYVLGGGLELALACDFRVAADNTELGFPEIKLGFIPAWRGTQRLPFTVGLSNAKRLIMLGDRVQADEAYEMGLVDKVVPLTELNAEAEALAQKLCELQPAVLKHAKLTVNSVNKVTTDGLKSETESFVQLFSAKETKEKISAFWFRRNKK
jgi:enoyl-CoA hydratase/carnithine racemase